ncbi:MAG: hypothetical protein AAF721_20685 [Myxococcota bacterium]
MTRRSTWFGAFALVVSCATGSAPATLGSVHGVVLPRFVPEVTGGTRQGTPAIEFQLGRIRLDGEPILELEGGKVAPGGVQVLGTTSVIKPLYTALDARQFDEVDVYFDARAPTWELTLLLDTMRAAGVVRTTLVTEGHASFGAVGVPVVLEPIIPPCVPIPAADPVIREQPRLDGPSAPEQRSRPQLKRAQPNPAQENHSVPVAVPHFVSVAISGHSTSIHLGEELLLETATPSTHRAVHLLSGEVRTLRASLPETWEARARFDESVDIDTLYGILAAVQTWTDGNGAYEDLFHPVVLDLDADNECRGVGLAR